jgi:hypothetical protein
MTLRSTAADRLVVAASGITIDGDGHSITVTTSGIAIDASGAGRTAASAHTALTVRNIAISAVVTAISAAGNAASPGLPGGQAGTLSLDNVTSAASVSASGGACSCIKFSRSRRSH